MENQAEYKRQFPVPPDGAMQAPPSNYFRCMTCMKVYREGEFPINPSRGHGDGCCSIGSLIEERQVMDSRNRNNKIWPMVDVQKLDVGRITMTSYVRKLFYDQWHLIQVTTSYEKVDVLEQFQVHNDLAYKTLLLFQFMTPGRSNMIGQHYDINQQSEHERLIT